MTQKISSSFTNCHIFALKINYFSVLLSVRALLARSPKRNKRKVVSGSRVTLPVNFACKPGLSYNPLAMFTLAVGLPYLLVSMALIKMNQIARRDWLPERARWSYLAAPDYPLYPPKPYNKSVIDQACSVRMAGY